MASPANSIIRPPEQPIPPPRNRAITRSLTRNFLVDPTGSDIMDTAEEISAVITAQMSRLTQPIAPYDGTSTPAKEWLNDFDSYMSITGRRTDDKKKHSLTTLLTGEAKDWLRLQPPETRASYKLIRKGLEARFSPSEEQLFSCKRALYSLRQTPGQPFAQYLTLIQQTALDTGVDQRELVRIAIDGAQQALKPHLAGTKCATIDDLLVLPAGSRAHTLGGSRHHRGCHVSDEPSGRQRGKPSSNPVQTRGLRRHQKPEPPQGTHPGAFQGP